MENAYLFFFLRCIKGNIWFDNNRERTGIIQNRIVDNIIMTSLKVDDTFSDANKWTCQKCTYLNSISVYPKCILCDPSDSPLVNTSPVI